MSVEKEKAGSSVLTETVSKRIDKGFERNALAVSGCQADLCSENDRMMVSQEGVCGGHASTKSDTGGDAKPDTQLLSKVAIQWAGKFWRALPACWGPPRAASATQGPTLGYVDAYLLDREQ